MIECATENPVEAAVSEPIKLDIDGLVEQYKDDPRALALAVQKFYEETQHESTPSIIMIQRGDGKWVIFEGTCTPKTRKFKVIRHITDFECNQQNPRRPPTVAMNFLCGLASTNGLPCWIP